MIVCNTGTYMMTTIPGTAPGYSEKAGYPPVELGGVELHVKPTKLHEGKRQREWLDIRVVE